MLANWFAREDQWSEKTNTLLFKSCISMMHHVLDMVPIVSWWALHLGAMLLLYVSLTVFVAVVR